MTDTADTDAAVDANNVHRLMAGAFTALRIFTGLVWISNALAKIFDVGNYDWGFFSFNLITLGAARELPPTPRPRLTSHPLARFTATSSCPIGVSSAHSSRRPSSPSVLVSYSGWPLGWPQWAVYCCSLRSG